MRASCFMPNRYFKEYEKEYDFTDVFNNHVNSKLSSNSPNVEIKETPKDETKYPSIEEVLESIVSQIPRLHDDVETKYVESPNETDLIFHNKTDKDSIVDNTPLNFIIRIPEFDELLDSINDDDLLKDLNFPTEFPAYEYQYYTNTLAHNSIKDGIDLESVDFHWERVKFEEGTYINCDLRYFDLSCLGQFDVVLVDPPWRTKEQGQEGYIYNTLTNEEIINLKIQCLSQSGFCFLWTTNYQIKVAMNCLKKWGYKYVDRIIWIKKTDDNNISLSEGELFLESSEMCLIGVKKGRGKSHLEFVQKVSNDLIFAPIKEKHQKPQQLYSIIEKLYPRSRKIELFGRNNNIRRGWLTLGNQLGKQFDLKIDDVECCNCNIVISFGIKRYKNKKIPNRNLCHKCFIEKKEKLEDYFVILNNLDKLCFHEFYVCANCKSNPLGGIRFTCQECQSFHLCELCYDIKSIPEEYKFTHYDNHTFICFEVPEEKNKEIINFFKCSSCGNYPIEGNIFKCKVCSNVTICQNCFFERKEPIGHNSTTHDMELII